ASLAHPGGNITGLTNIAIELAGKRVDLLKELMPNVSHAALLWDEANPAAEFNLKEKQTAAVSLGLTLHVFAVSGSHEFSHSFAVMRSEHVGALLIGPSPLFLGQRRELVELAARNHLPTLYTVREYAQVGGLMSYGPHLPDLYRRAAAFVDKILKGAK